MWSFLRGSPEIRLAEEYDAAQDRGEARRHGDQISQTATMDRDGSIALATAADVGGKKALAEAREMARAEKPD